MVRNFALRRAALPGEGQGPVQTRSTWDPVQARSTWPVQARSTWDPAQTRSTFSPASLSSAAFSGGSSVPEITVSI